ncbi:MAG: alpha-amylase family glycosyl hydrolase [bacterium]|nr:alpha-amylase family glycosyl hydrolase [bacterium]
MEVLSPEMVAIKLKERSTRTIDFKNYALGYTILEDGIVFRLFAPKADQVQIVFYDNYEHLYGTDFRMLKDDEGIWNYFFPSLDIVDSWYAYKLDVNEKSSKFEWTDKYIADPFSRLVTSRNHYLGFAKTKIIKPHEFDWEDDTFQAPKDLRDLVIYETHIKDLVAHPSAKTYVQGVYNDFWQAEVGGIKHLKKLGVNCVEFLPLQKFAYFEPPFGTTISSGLTNTWNHYSKNYWGYMTSFFFCPETIYASDGNLNHGSAVGRNINALNELKELVKRLHAEGISVIMDVVYNHASQYDLNPLKYTAKDEYFRLDDHGNYLNDSWTGNDINTRNPNARKLIVESVKYWMQEFHIDGFRFDLAGIIDWETVDQIKQEARKINSNAILIAEPWGGEYKPAGFSEHGWASWNDKLRNGFKGYDPVNDKGLLFGSWHHGCNRYALENFIRGTLKTGEHGLFRSSEHAVNYLEAHDGYTLGDFIRIALNPQNKEQIFKKKNQVVKLNSKELEIAKLAAMALMVSQGVSMIHAGQEWARAKVIRDPKGIDPRNGKLDHDSYNKDNETNWLNFNEIQSNQELFDYYRELIKLRLESPALRKSDPGAINFKVYLHPLHITFSIDGKNTNDPYDYFISLNCDPHSSHKIDLPEGDWTMVANARKCNVEGIRTVKNQYRLPASTGVILRRLRLKQA